MVTRKFDSPEVPKIWHNKVHWKSCQNEMFLEKFPVIENACIGTKKILFVNKLL